MALPIANALNTFLTGAADTATVARVIDAFCGVTGNASLTDPVQRRAVAVEAVRAYVQQTVQQWERQQAIAAVANPAAPPVN